MAKKILFDQENERRPYLAVNAVILRKRNGQEEILLGKRRNVAGAGFWYVPGGHVRETERISDALAREVKEETGLKTEVGKLLWWEENFKDGPHHVTLYFEAVLTNPQQTPKNLEPDKCEQWSWFPVDKPPQPLWLSLSKFLQAYREKTRIISFATASVDYIGTGVAAVIRDKKGRVLLQKRGRLAKNEVGCWKLPGGTIEWGEKAEEALRREIKEELGVEIKIDKFLFCLDDILAQEGQHWLVPFYLCQINKGSPQNLEPGKIDEIKWVPLDKLPSKLAFGTKEAFSKIT